MINIFCLWIGNKYPLDSVIKLKESIKFEHNFVCLTDKPHKQKIEGITFLPAVVSLPNNWCKISLFTPRSNERFKGKALYLDLESEVFRLKERVNASVEGKMNLLQGLETSFMVWDIGKFNELYTRLKSSDINKLDGFNQLFNKLIDKSEVNFIKLNNSTNG